MPQSATADVNVGIMRAREVFIDGLIKGIPYLVLAAIDSFNGCLPPELKIRYITEKQYRQRITPKNTVECPTCSIEIPLNMDRIIITTPKISKRQALVLQKPTQVRYVICVDCNKKVFIDLDKSLSFTTIPKSKFEEEFISRPPNMNTIYDRAMNRIAFEKWASSIWGIIEDRNRQFRNMYSLDNDDSEEVE